MIRTVLIIIVLYAGQGTHTQQLDIADPKTCEIEATRLDGKSIATERSMVGAYIRAFCVRVR